MKETIITCDRCKTNTSKAGEVVAFQLIINGVVKGSGDLCFPCVERVRKDFEDLILMRPVKVGEFTVVRKEVA
jgi:hypothetical protein